MVLLSEYIILIYMPYWIKHFVTTRLRLNRVCVDPIQSRHNPPSISGTYPWWILAEVWHIGHTHFYKEVSSAVKAGTDDRARPCTVVTRFAFFIIDIKLYTRHKQSPWTIQYRFAYPKIETLRVAMSCLPIPLAWNPSLVNTRRSRRLSRRNSVDSPLPTCRRATVFKQRRINYTPWFFFLI